MLNTLFFTKETPSSEQLLNILTNYLGDLGNIEIKESIVKVILPGKHSYPLKTVQPKYATGKIYPEVRSFELHLHLKETKPFIDVIARHADDLTHRIADGFTALICSYYSARSAE